MSNNHETDTELVMQQSFCAFLDILGFTEHVKKNAGNHEAFKAIVAALMAAREKFKAAEGWGILKVKTFSDNVVIALKVYPNLHSLASFSEFISQYQNELIHHGLLARGGIALGDIYISDDMIYGDALIKSYEIESKHAVVPAVMISEEVLELACKKRFFEAQSYWSTREMDWYFIMSDGKTYLNYLKSSLIYFEGRDGFHSCYLDIDFLRKHQTLISNGLAVHRDTPSVYKKYVFLANYHNTFCKSCESWREYKDDLIINIPSDEVSFLPKQGFFDWHPKSL
ncbi:hypothetical protein [Pseudomonas yamanorum]